MTVADAIVKMIAFYEGSLHDIDHFLKVYSYAKTIGEQEGLDLVTQKTLEYAAVLHDIACPLCREKFGAAIGSRQEEEGIPLTRAFFTDTDIDPAIAKRVVYLVSHHHTLEKVDGMDYQILLEADYLVNAGEQKMKTEEIMEYYDKVFRTNTGRQLLRSIYLK